MQQREHLLLSPSLGTQRSVTSFHFGPEGTGRKVYVQSSLHADELPGMLVAWKLRQRLAALEEAGRLKAEVVLVPVANPIGLAQSLLGLSLGRFDMASGHNFNRHYPALAETVLAAVSHRLGQDASANVACIRQVLRETLAARSPSTELDSLRLTLMQLACDADVVLDLHCDFTAGLHLYTLTPQWPQVEPLARHLGSCAQLLATDSGDQPFDEACSQFWLDLTRLAEAEARAQERPVPSIPLATVAVTVELRGQDSVSHALAEQDADGLIAYLRETGHISGPAVPLPPLPYPATPLAGSENLVAPHAGVVAFHCEPGTRVTAGQPVADIIDPISGQVTPLAASHDGMLYARARDPYARPGTWVAKVATSVAFKTGKLLSA